MPNHDDYWGATGADLPRVPPPAGVGTPPGAPSGPPDALDVTAPLAAVDVPRPDGPTVTRPPTRQQPEPPDSPLYRETARIPSLPATAGADSAGGVPPEEPDFPPATPGPPPEQQHRRLAPVLLLAVAAVAGVVAWRLLLTPGLGGTLAIPVPTSAAAVQPTATPGPSSASVPAPIGTTGYLPLPLPALSPAPARTVTQTVLVTVPAPHAPSATPAPTTTTPTTAATTPGATTTPPAPPPTISTAGWVFGPTGVGPLTLGMPVAVAAQQGLLVPDAAAASGFRTSPALLGVELWVANGVVTGVVITDPGVRSAEGLGVGSRLSEVSHLYGPAIVMLTLRDATGSTLTLPGVQYPTTYLAFVPATGATPTPPPTATPAATPPTTAPPSAAPTPPTPTPSTASPSTGPSPSASTPADDPVVEAIVIAQQQPVPSASPTPTITPPTASATPPPPTG